MGEARCKDCTHYRQHHVLDEQSCTAVDCGHCIYPRQKHRKPDARACSYYELRMNPAAMPDRERVVQFLTEEMLQYILSLNLPPEMK